MFNLFTMLVGLGYAEKGYFLTKNVTKTNLESVFEVFTDEGKSGSGAFKRNK